MRRLVNTRGQVWVETVIYTLIGIAIIGLVLSVAKPKIDEKKDEVVINQAIDALNIIDGKIDAVAGSTPGNRRIIDLEVGRGEVQLDVEGNNIVWIVDSSYLYSELDITIPVGNIDVTTKQGGEKYQVFLNVSYSEDLVFEEQTTGVKSLLQAPTPYQLMVENDGVNALGEVIVLIRES
ncbi:hypothetical protein HN876_01265 [archaeon]|nr:hypothetical protein [archaeon]MBT6182461.1 hypothetical protein [archaeon]MBT6606302.1 hypothetical protein [archaeon]MBT7251529.1 hypothetical protein [archaeon]